MEDNRKRNIERRRETSRYAARDRRGKETEIFNDLKDVVPIVSDGPAAHLDRIALLRVGATFCRLHKTASNVLKTSLGKEFVETWDEDMVSECLDGFILIADSDGSILYITESVNIYLGLTQTDLTGRSLREFFHPTDYDHFLKLSAKLNTPRHLDCLVGVNVVFRMKTVISPRGRCLNLKSALFKPISFMVHAKRSTGGHVLLMQGATIPAGQGTINSNASALTKYSEQSSGTFMTRHTCDMMISYVSDRLSYVLKVDGKSLIGTSFYQLVHPDDIAILAPSMKELFAKTHVRTPYYRLTAANKSTAWIQTEATTVSHTTKGQKGQYVICVHYVLGIQKESEKMLSNGTVVRVNVKTELDDSLEYVGRQPEIVECVDFTPLVGIDDVFDAETLNPCLGVSSDESSSSSENGSGAESIDDALHWLFRPDPSGPAPEVQSRFGGAAPPDDPSLASAQFLVDQQDRRPFYGQAAGQTGDQSYSPLAEGVSQCAIGGPAGVEPGPRRGGNPGPLGCGGAADRPRRLSAIQTSDTLAMSSVDVRVGERPVADLFPTLPPAHPQPPQQLQMTQNFNQPIICDDLQWEEPDLSGLAPFVDCSEMEQLGGDLPNDFFLELGIKDWRPVTPSMVPAAVAVKAPLSPTSPPAKRNYQNSYDAWNSGCQYHPDFEPYWQSQPQQSSWQPTYSANPNFNPAFPNS